MNDHRVEAVSKEVVFKDAFGGEGYRSACNLLYISKHIKDSIDKYNCQLFTEKHGFTMEIPKPIVQEVKAKNYEFSVE